MQIATLDPTNRRDVEGVVDLHFRHLADSPVVQFGRRFVRDFYYTTLVTDGLVGATLGRDGDQVVGFISYTTDPLHFMTIGMRRHLIRLSWLMLLSVLARPLVIRDILAVMRLMRKRGAESRAAAAQADVGEVLSLVSEKSHSSKIPEGGTSRLTVRMFEEAMAFFRTHGIRRVHLLVKPENKASNLFCSVMGCAFEKIEGLEGPLHRYTYTMPEQASAEVAS